MIEPVKEANAEAKPNTVADNLTDAAFIANRLAKPKEAPMEIPEEKEEPESDPEKPQNEDGDKEKAKAPSIENVLSKAKSGNIDDLTEEELSIFAKHFGSRAVSRYGELVAKRKIAEEETARLRAELARRDHEKQADAPQPIKDNPFADIADEKSLKAKESEIKQSIEVLESAIDDAADLRMDDVAATVGDKEYTKKQLRDSLRAARKARDEYLPDVARRLDSVNGAKQTRVNVDAQIRKELPWVDNAEDDRTKRFNAIMADPRLKKLDEAAPDIAAQLPYWFAHATNSLLARREIPIDDGTLKKTKGDPPDNPSVGTSNSRSPTGGTSRKMADLEKKFDETGSNEDWISLRTARIGQRHLIR